MNCEHCQAVTAARDRLSRATNEMWRLTRELDAAKVEEASAKAALRRRLRFFTAEDA